MISFDFHSNVNGFIDLGRYNDLMNQKNTILDQFYASDMIGWIERIDECVLDKIKYTANMIKSNFDCLIMIGIGGSFLGSYAFDQVFKNSIKDDSFEIIYAGTTLSSKSMEELLMYLQDKNFCINVISKSGTTMETTITYKLLKDLLKRKYSPEEMKKHIIITTDREKGTLREEVNNEGYLSFEIPNNIGGRYSFITPAHLLPLAINYDIDSIIHGYYYGKRYIDEAYEYAVMRQLLFNTGKVVENFCFYDQSMIYFGEWLKQLFGETEGKNGVGVLPMSTIHTRDLHSLGQLLQEGNKIIYETFLKVNESPYYISYQNRSLNDINNLVEDSVIRAHTKGGVPCLEIILDQMNEDNLASLIYFFQLSAAFSAYLFHVNPFDQPGVEVYKQEVRNSLEG